MSNGQKRVIEVDDDEAESIVAASRHKELSGTLKAIAMSLSQKDDSAIVEAIAVSSGKQESIMSKVATAIEKIQKPEVNIEVYNKELLSLLTEIRQGQKENKQDNQRILDALENRLLPSTFDLVKNYGVTQSVKVNYKTATEINNNKK